MEKVDPHDQRQLRGRLMPEMKISAVEWTAFLREAWHAGYYHATNGKWGPPEPGACPYGDSDD